MKKEPIIPVERIEQSIYLIRGLKVMLDRDLAALYGVETRVLKQAVRRNADRFPDDFMFVLDRQEFANLTSQSVISSSWGGLRHAPMAFTEQGVAMLATVLNSKRAIDVNIAIMRTFVKLRQMLDSHVQLAKKLAELEAKYDGQFRIVRTQIRAAQLTRLLPLNGVRPSWTCLPRFYGRSRRRCGRRSRASCSRRPRPSSREPCSARSRDRSRDPAWCS